MSVGLRKRRDAGSALNKVLLALVVAIVASVRVERQAHGHGPAEWIERGLYRDPRSGELCCGPEDCQVVPARDVVETGDGWQVLSSGERIPRREALKSHDGDFWRCQRTDGSRRCWFFPVPGS